MERVWLSHYPAGIPAEVNVHEFASLRDMLLRSCERFRSLPAFSNMGATITYGELDRSSRNFAAYLQKSLGLRKGDRVAIMMPNLLQYPVALFGVLRAGMVVVNVNPLYTPRELEHQLNDSGAVAIVVLENFAHTLQEVLDRTRRAPGRHHDRGRRPVSAGQGAAHEPRGEVREAHGAAVEDCGRHRLQRSVARGAWAGLDDVPLATTTSAFLQYTGGTTGVAKGAVLTHGNMVANVQQMAAWMARDLREGKEVFVCPLPLYHVFALTSSLVFMKIGAQTVLVTNPTRHARLHPDAQEIPLHHHHRRQHAVPGAARRARIRGRGHARPEGGECRRHGRAARGGGALEAAHRRAADRRLRPDRDLTGGDRQPAGHRGVDRRDRHAVPSTEAIILDETRHECAVGEVGEICVRGPQVMRGYWNRPDETAKVFTRDGWLRTGDMGFVDERGRFRITDRKKDMIVVSGFKVFPNEIEDVVALHPAWPRSRRSASPTRSRARSSRSSW